MKLQQTPSTKEKIIEFLKEFWPSSVKQIVAHFGLYKTIIHRHLADLITSWILIKLWSVPRVLYKYNDNVIQSPSLHALDYSDIRWMDEQFFTFDSDGTILQWYQWFLTRCTQRWLDPQIQCNHYRDLISLVDKKRNRIWLIDVLPLLQKKWQPVYVDKLYVADTYILWHFWESPLWSLAFYGKQTQDSSLSRKVVEKIKVRFQQLIQQYNIDAICYAPVSIKRSVQLMDILARELTWSLPLLSLKKFFPWAVIAQKTSKWDSARIKNSENTIFVYGEQKSYQRVLLVDDFIWSWATLNISAKKLKSAKLAKEVIGFAIVGNMDMSYEVINEV